MCSIGEDDFGDEGGLHAMVPDVKLVEEGDLVKDAPLCIKCKKAEAVYKLPFRDAECRECFLLYSRHKFRAALGSSKILPKNTKVALVFDGSSQSVVLLDMLHHAQSQNTFKKLHCEVAVVYIDDFQLLQQNGASGDDYEKFLEKLRLFLTKYDLFERFFVPLVNVEKVINCITNVNDMKEEQYHLEYLVEKLSFISSINSIKSLTSRQDFIKHHRSKIISVVSKHLNCDFAFMANTSPDLASDLLTAVALGRGGSAALDVALVDDRLSYGIKLIRPLKDLTNKEIELYLKAQDLQPLQHMSYGVEAGPTASLQNLTKSFVDNLQQNFSATVSTVYRTGHKIAVNNDINAMSLEKLDLSDTTNLKTEDKYCSFCNSLLDWQNSKTLLAIEYSRLVSENGSTLDKRFNFNQLAKINAGFSTKKPYLKKLCHGCRNIYADSSNENLLM